MNSEQPRDLRKPQYVWWLVHDRSRVCPAWKAPRARPSTPRPSSLRWVFSLFIACSVPLEAHSGAFIEADAINGVDSVAHPAPYTGVGGNLNITVGIDPTSLHNDEMVVSVKNAIRVLNDLKPTRHNLVTELDNKLAANEYDFESVLLHELGHAIGLAHPNLADRVAENFAEYTQSEQGGDAQWDLEDGTHEIPGSSDDARGDDWTNESFCDTL